MAEATGVVRGREIALRPGPFPAASRAQDAPGQRSQLRLPGFRQFLLPQGGQCGYPPPPTAPALELLGCKPLTAAGASGTRPPGFRGSVWSLRGREGVTEGSGALSHV